MTTKGRCEMAYEKGKQGGHTEHCGAKRGRGYWGVKAEAKKVSRKLRRLVSACIVREEKP